MLRELLSVFKADSLIDQAYTKSFDMLHTTRDMFKVAKDVLRNTEHNQIDIDIESEDSTVNKYEREVRKDVFRHLAMTGTDNLPQGLALVSVVIDIERIGDYTKNIVELASSHKEKLNAGILEDQLLSIEEAIEQNFERTIEVFESSDDEAGRKLLADYKWVSKKSDEMLFQLVRGEKKLEETESSVVLALYVRSIKRIHSHLRNVTSSVVNPFHRIGYKAKNRK